MSRSQKRITLYTAVESSFPHIVTLALEEAHLQYDTIVFELVNKPKWYEEKVYPTAKVPYFVYGGPKLQPGDSPSPDLPQFGESLVIAEFLADTFPEARLLPADPFLRAKACLFYRAIEERYTSAFIGFFLKQAPKEVLLDTIEHIQGLLPPAGGFALDPPVSRLAPGTAAEVLATLRESPRFARIQRYFADSMARPSVKKTWDPAANKRRYDFFLAQAQKEE